MRLAQRGFTYLAILLAVAIAGAGLAATGVLWSVESQRARERELLWVGAQYRNALQSYSRQGTVGGRLPRSLEDLVRDPRTADVRRHIRRLYPDPLTGSAEWGLIRVADGGIIGVYSLSERAPIKRAHFPPGFEHFEGAERFADWKFLLDPRM
ncbi:MAG TPA: type II secretion system protein, partial [Pelomicrobium sp.]|nr:type II secretion system protein [Pelomicrobium sp.]